MLPASKYPSRSSRPWLTHLKAPRRKCTEVGPDEVERIPYTASNAGGGRGLGATKQHCGVGSIVYFDDCSTLITSLQIYGAPRGISIYCTSTAHRCHRLTALCDDSRCCSLLNNSTTLCLFSFLICFHRRPCLVEHVVFFQHVRLQNARSQTPSPCLSKGLRCCNSPNLYLEPKWLRCRVL